VLWYSCFLRYRCFATTTLAASRSLRLAHAQRIQWPIGYATPSRVSGGFGNYFCPHFGLLGMSIPPVSCPCESDTRPLHFLIYEIVVIKGINLQSILVNDME